ncbi:hypothetical protein F5884DRAFT_318914 [Xylogone sp. PMI_703]|nr:hypothetical protein F5884DRAFT_318914 [Xylogone sp. PMI_703]
MDPQTTSATIQYPQPKKRGPKPKPLHERKYKPRTKPVSALRRSYSKERKIEVLMFLLYHQVGISPRTTYRVPKYRTGLPESTNSCYRPVTIKEASEFWKIPEGTIHEWWVRRDRILSK